MPWPCAVGDSRSRLKRDAVEKDATALRRGGFTFTALIVVPSAVFRWRDFPGVNVRTTAQGRGIGKRGRRHLLAVNVKDHGARPWHRKARAPASASSERKGPRRKAVA
jgi:hypothetical protein